MELMMSSRAVRGWTDPSRDPPSMPLLAQRLEWIRERVDGMHGRALSWGELEDSAGIPPGTLGAAVRRGSSLDEGTAKALAHLSQVGWLWVMTGRARIFPEPGQRFLPDLATAAARLEWAVEEVSSGTARPISWKDLAQRSGIAIGELRAVRRSGGRLTPRQAVALGEALGVCADWLAYGIQTSLPLAAPAHFPTHVPAVKDLALPDLPTPAERLRWLMQREEAATNQPLHWDDVLKQARVPRGTTSTSLASGGPLRNEYARALGERFNVPPYWLQTGRLQSDIPPPDKIKYPALVLLSDRMDWGKSLHETRHGRLFAWDEIAGSVGYAPADISLYLRNRRPLPPDVAADLATLFGINADWLRFDSLVATPPGGAARRRRRGAAESEASERIATAIKQTQQWVGVSASCAECLERIMPVPGELVKSPSFHALLQRYIEECSPAIVAHLQEHFEHSDTARIGATDRLIWAKTQAAARKGSHASWSRIIDVAGVPQETFHAVVLGLDTLSPQDAQKLAGRLGAASLWLRTGLAYGYAGDRLPDLPVLNDRLEWAKALYEERVGRSIRWSFICQEIGINQAFHSMWSSGKRPVSEEHAKQLGTFLGVQAAWLRTWCSVSQGRRAEVES